jgi:hypothetical protein
VNARPRDGDHQNLLASLIWRSSVTPDKIRQDPLAVVALSPKNDDTIELFSLRLSNRQTFLRAWKQGKPPVRRHHISSVMIDTKEYTRKLISLCQYSYEST